MGLNNLPKVVTRQPGRRESNSQPSSCDSNTLDYRATHQSTRGHCVSGRCRNSVGHLRSWQSTVDLLRG